MLKETPNDPNVVMFDFGRANSILTVSVTVPTMLGLGLEPLIGIQVSFLRDNVTFGDSHPLIDTVSIVDGTTEYEISTCSSAVRYAKVFVMCPQGPSEVAGTQRKCGLSEVQFNGAP